MSCVNFISATHRPIWDLSELSSPFRDTSYRPRLFYRRSMQDDASPRQLTELDVGFAHESNGKAGAESRSINMLFVRPTYAFKFANNSRRLNVQPMVYAYTSTGGHNHDIADYRGYVDLHVEYLWGTNDSARADRALPPWMARVDLRLVARADHNAKQSPTRSCASFFSLYSSRFSP